MMVTMFTTKGCVAKCTFCQRGSKGYSVYDLDKLESHLKNLRDNCNVGFLCVDDENFGLFRVIKRGGEADIVAVGCEVERAASLFCT